jgi:hypothetical protein
MIEEHAASISAADAPRPPTLAPAHRRRLIGYALGWAAGSSALIVAICTYSPGVIDTFLHGAPGLLAVLIVAVVVALVDVAVVCALCYGLALLLEGMRGSAVQSVEVLRDLPTPRARLLRAVNCGRVGILRAGTPTLLTELRWGESYTITYSPRARLLWTCAPISPAEEAC